MGKSTIRLPIYFMKECSVMSSTDYVKIPERVEFIEEDAFGWHERFQCVTIPNTVTTIGVEAFSSIPFLGYYGR